MLTHPRRRQLAERLPLLAHPALNVVLTWALVSFAWIFFRANSVPDTRYVVRHFFDASATWREGTLCVGLAAVKVFYLIVCDPQLLAQTRDVDSHSFRKDPRLTGGCRSASSCRFFGLTSPASFSCITGS